MASQLFPVAALLLGSALLLVAGGIHGLLLPIRGSIEGFTTTELGLIGTGWAVGFVAGCLVVPQIVRRVGHVRAYGVMASIASVVILLNLLFVSPWAWIGLRAFSGFCFAGAAMIHFVGLNGAYWVAAVAISGAGLIAWLAPEMSSESHAGLTRAKPRVQDIARDHAKVFLTLGLGILLVSALRSSRQVVIPLWADHLGLAPTTASIIYGLVAAIDMSVFYPAGTIMDRRGRLWVALPSVLLMGGALMATSLTTGIVPFLIVSLILGFGNGISSGIVMTLGADASPAHGRTEFLGIWRLIADVGNSLGPVILSAITAVASLTIGVASVGTLGLAAAAVLWRWLPRRSPPTR